MKTAMMVVMAVMVTMAVELTHNQHAVFENTITYNGEWLNQYDCEQWVLANQDKIEQAYRADFDHEIWTDCNEVLPHNLTVALWYLLGERDFIELQDIQDELVFSICNDRD